MMKTVRLAVLGVLLLVTAWMFMHRNEPRYSVQATVLDITEDVAGMRQANLMVSNAGCRAVWLAPSWVLERDWRGLRGATPLPWRTNLLPATVIRLDFNYVMLSLPFSPRSKKLEPGECYRFKHSLPFDDSKWRAAFGYDQYDISRPSSIDFLRIHAGLGLWKPPVTEAASTGWIER